MVHAHIGMNTNTRRVVACNRQHWYRGFRLENTSPPYSVRVWIPCRRVRRECIRQYQWHIFLSLGSDSTQNLNHERISSCAQLIVEGEMCLTDSWNIVRERGHRGCFCSRRRGWRHYQGRFHKQKGGHQLTWCLCYNDSSALLSKATNPQVEIK